jgi:hypothetical protein
MPPFSRRAILRASRLSDRACRRSWAAGGGCPVDAKPRPTEEGTQWPPAGFFSRQATQFGLGSKRLASGKFKAVRGEAAVQPDGHRPRGSQPGSAYGLGRVERHAADLCGESGDDRHDVRGLSAAPIRARRRQAPPGRRRRQSLRRPHNCRYAAVGLGPSSQAALIMKLDDSTDGQIWLEISIAAAQAITFMGLTGRAARTTFVLLEGRPERG